MADSITAAEGGDSARRRVGNLAYVPRNILVVIRGPVKTLAWIDDGANCDGHDRTQFADRLNKEIYIRALLC
jgi:hypothetical protein